ncbi:putative oxidoreductase EphD [Mycolicibacterium vanbaalenii]|uniref:Putative oxidoreductase EphD n=1 Tax=Mycolicibacterium vanbaalenii TaxID=110539 RepID=A0A5S9R2L1_MYCVN|nr:SDR family oxidoreductase [Mycolicibacterium vanbaalenii]CAA0128060.1 putative oxidoreductase EphD [Mycolicibacterium vanbaalenii]
MTRRFVETSDGVRIAVHEEGSANGPTLVLAHGHPDTHRVWDSVVPLLEARYRIIRYDNRGAGDSTAPKATSAYTMQRFADDFAAVIDDVSPGSAVHVLAHDWGSTGVWEFLTRPGSADRVASLTSVSGPSHHHVNRYIVDTLSRPYRPRRFLRGLGQLATLAAALPRSVPVKMYRANFVGTVAGARTAPRELSVEVPVQLIVNTLDPYIRPHFYDDVAGWVPQLWRRDIKAGHGSPTSHPQVLARSVAQLVDHLEGAPAARELLRAQVGRLRKPFGDMLVSVTGAGSGIGRETALAFARDGADVVISDVDQPALDETARLLAAVGAQAPSYTVDVADAAAVENFAERVCTEHGVPDIVVNNAGVGHAGFFLDTPAEEFDRVLDINFGGVVNGCRSFATRLAERGTGGHIVNVASMASYTPVNVMNAYCTSKAAVYMFSDCLRAELDSAGIGLTTICPGVIGTNIVETTRFSLPEARSHDAEKVRGRARRGFGVRRYGPEKVAKAIVAAVKSNKAIRPVTPEAYVLYGLAHAAPPAMRSGARGGNVL